MPADNNIIFASIEIIGVILGCIGIYIGLTKGRHVVQMTGGGVVAVTVKYLLIATELYLIGFIIKALNAFFDIEVVEFISSIVMLGLGICFFILFWELADHMEKFKEYT